MLHQIELERFARAPARMAGAAARHERFQQRLSLSRRAPYLWLAKANTALYLGGVIVLGIIASLLRRRAPDTVDRELGAFYAYVPEMAIHKKIELTAYLRENLRGNGVDFGAGSGIVGGILKRHSRIASLHGVDSHPQTEHTKSNGYDGCTGASIEDVPFADASFDFAVSICVVEHVPNLRAVVGEAARILKPGGVFALSTPSPGFRQAGLRFQFLRLLGRRKAAEKLAADEDLRCLHYHYLSAMEWRAILEDAGFEEVAVKPLFSRAQQRIYDLVNYGVWVPVIYPNEIASVWLSRHAKLNRLSSWATARLGAWISAWPVSERTATHHFIVAKMPVSSNVEKEPS